MTTLTAIPGSDAARDARLAKLDMKVEVIIIPVSDVDRAKDFYLKLGWRLDADLSFGGRVRVVQVTPHGSACSLQFGVNLTSAAPGSGKGYVVVSDLEAARNALLAAGTQVGEIFHLGPNGPARGWILSAAAMPRAPSSKIPTATVGCCRRLQAGCLAVWSPARPLLSRPPIWRARFGVRRPRMVSMRRV